MAYTTPPTFVAGTTLAAADLNILGDDIAYLKAITDGVSFSGVRVTRAAATNFASGGSAHAIWTAEDFDYGSWWSSGANVVVPASAIPAGFTTIAVDVVLRAVWAANGTGLRRATLEQNGTGVAAPSVPGISGDTTELVFPYTLVVAAADTLSMLLYQNSGSTLAVSSMSMIVKRIAPVA